MSRAKIQSIYHLKVIKLLFNVIMQMISKNMFKRFQIDKLKLIFSIKDRDNKIEQYFRVM